MLKRLLNILFWSVISAAFIGPGTITTAAKAGAEYGFSLLWALVFSTIACLVLQEAVARLSIDTGVNLGQAIRSHFRGRKSFTLVLILLVGAIIIGSAAYETGNLLGAVAGLEILLPVRSWLLVLVIGLFAAMALFMPSLGNIAKLLGIIVALMGIAFFTTAVLLKPSVGEILKGSLVPFIPQSQGAGLLILGLIGTTVVPYNLFLGSGMADPSQAIKEMRFGLGIAVILGGMISMSVLIVGSYVNGIFSYDSLVSALGNKLGSWAVVIFAIGMFAAGFSSAVTAPLASAITAKSLFEGNKGGWNLRSGKYMGVWLSVLLSGVILGMAGLKPIPVIIMAQALNGLILPFISIFLIMVINNPRIMGDDKLNGLFSNILMLAVVFVTIVLGLMNLMKAAADISDTLDIGSGNLLIVNLIISSLVWLIVIYNVLRIRKLKLLR